MLDFYPVDPSYIFAGHVHQIYILINFANGFSIVSCLYRGDGESEEDEFGTDIDNPDNSPLLRKQLQTSEDQQTASEDRQATSEYRKATSEDQQGSELTREGRRHIESESESSSVDDFADAMETVHTSDTDDRVRHDHDRDTEPEDEDMYGEQSYEIDLAIDEALAFLDESTEDGNEKQATEPYESEHVDDIESLPVSQPLEAAASSLEPSLPGEQAVKELDISQSVPVHVDIAAEITNAEESTPISTEQNQTIPDLIESHQGSPQSQVETLESVPQEQESSLPSDVDDNITTVNMSVEYHVAETLDVPNAPITNAIDDEVQEYGSDGTTTSSDADTVKDAGGDVAAREQELTEKEPMEEQFRVEDDLDNEEQQQVKDQVCFDEYLDKQPVVDTQQSMPFESFNGETNEKKQETVQRLDDESDERTDTEHHSDELINSEGKVNGMQIPRIEIDTVPDEIYDLDDILDSAETEIVYDSEPSGSVSDESEKEPLDSVEYVPLSDENQNQTKPFTQHPIEIEVSIDMTEDDVEIKGDVLYEDEAFEIIGSDEITVAVTPAPSSDVRDKLASLTGEEIQLVSTDKNVSEHDTDPKLGLIECMIDVDSSNNMYSPVDVQDKRDEVNEGVIAPAVAKPVECTNIGVVFSSPVEIENASKNDVSLDYDIQKEPKDQKPQPSGDVIEVHVHSPDQSTNVRQLLSSLTGEEIPHDDTSEEEGDLCIDDYIIIDEPDTEEYDDKQVLLSGDVVSEDAIAPNKVTSVPDESIDLTVLEFPTDAGDDRGDSERRDSIKFVADVNIPDEPISELPLDTNDIDEDDTTKGKEDQRPEPSEDIIEVQVNKPVPTSDERDRLSNYIDEDDATKGKEDERPEPSEDIMEVQMNKPLPTSDERDLLSNDIDEDTAKGKEDQRPEPSEDIIEVRVNKPVPSSDVRDLLSAMTGEDIPHDDTSEDEGDVCIDDYIIDVKEHREYVKEEEEEEAPTGQLIDEDVIAPAIVKSVEASIDLSALEYLNDAADGNSDDECRGVHPEEPEPSQILEEDEKVTPAIIAAKPDMYFDMNDVLSKLPEEPQSNVDSPKFFEDEIECTDVRKKANGREQLKKLLKSLEGDLSVVVDHSDSEVSEPSPKRREITDDMVREAIMYLMQKPFLHSYGMYDSQDSLFFGFSAVYDDLLHPGERTFALISTPKKDEKSTVFALVASPSDKRGMNGIVHPAEVVENIAEDRRDVEECSIDFDNLFAALDKPAFENQPKDDHPSQQEIKTTPSEYPEKVEPEIHLSQESAPIEEAVPEQMKPAPLVDDPSQGVIEHLPEDSIPVKGISSDEIPQKGFPLADDFFHLISAQYVIEDNRPEEEAAPVHFLPVGEPAIDNASYEDVEQLPGDDSHPFEEAVPERMVPDRIPYSDDDSSSTSSSETSGKIKVTSICACSEEMKE